MIYKTLIDTHDLSRILAEPRVIVFDCRFSLTDPQRGRRVWSVSHIPGAIYADLDKDLSGPVEKGKTGRHPLPDIKTLANWLGHYGVDEKIQVVAYDDMGGAIAARLWWILRWLGHEAVAVLNGGWQTWIKVGYPVDNDEPIFAPKNFTPCPRRDMLVGMEVVQDKRNNPDYLVLDARSLDRYRGENENIDPIAGHIPGAISAPYSQNLNDSGMFRSREELQRRFRPMQEDASTRHTIVYCGSGVTATHNILAMCHAGLGDALLYPGSWSEWITNPDNPIATGNSVFGEE